MDMAADYLISTARAGMEKQQEERAWQMWLVKYPQMTKDTFIPFSEFYKKQLAPAKVSKRSAEEILEDASEIRRKLGR